MALKKLLDDVRGQKALAVPKALYSRERLTRLVGEPRGERKREWLMPCSHRLNPPATEGQIEKAEARLGFRLPEPLRSLLIAADGGDLYSAIGRERGGVSC